MTEIVELSDSNESVLSIDEPSNKLINNYAEKIKKSICNDASDFEFPEVNFYHVIDQDVEDKEVSSTVNCNPLLCDVPTSSNVSQQRKQLLSLQKEIDSSDTEVDSNWLKKTLTMKQMKTLGKKKKSQFAEEKLKRQEQLLKERALKTITSKKLNSIKPGECMKFIEVILDKGIENFDFLSEVMNKLTDANLRYSINTEPISNSITWKRSVEHNYVDDSNEIHCEIAVENLKGILIIWNWTEVIMKIADGNFCASVSSIRSLLPDYTMLLLLFGMEDYFTSRLPDGYNNKKNSKSKSQKSLNKNNELKAYPKISRRLLETNLNEIEITSDCSSRLIDTPQDLAQAIYQYTKAVAEIPYKMEKNKSFKNKFDWYVMGDNRNTVKVDKDGNGLKRLWQQQLCQFTSTSLEIAEAICSVYPSPTDLLQAYFNGTEAEGLNLLKDIPIRRAAGPLTAARKVGPELSKKIYTMFMTKDGENCLN